jgi:DNA-binding transcriptional MerR regulator
MKEFRHKDVIKIFNLKTRTLISWSEKGLFQPLKKPSGPGNWRKYSYSNLIEIGFIEWLMANGMPLNKIKFLMAGNNFREMIKKRKWDSLFIYELNSRDEGQPFKSFDGHSYTMKREEYLKGSAKSVSSLVVDIGMIKGLVDKRIKEIGG